MLHRHRSRTVALHLQHLHPQGTIAWAIVIVVVTMFDEKLWTAAIDRVAVTLDDRFLFRFKDGTEVGATRVLYKCAGCFLVPYSAILTA